MLYIYYGRDGDTDSLPYAQYYDFIVFYIICGIFSFFLCCYCCVWCVWKCYKRHRVTPLVQRQPLEMTVPVVEDGDNLSLYDQSEDDALLADRIVNPSNYHNIGQ